MEQLIAWGSAHQVELLLFIVALLACIFIWLLALVRSNKSSQQFIHNFISSNNNEVISARFQQHLTEELSSLQVKLIQQQAQLSQEQQQHNKQGHQQLQHILHQHQQAFLQAQNQSLEQLHNLLTKTNQSNREEQAKSLKLSSEQLAEKVNELTNSTDARLKEISEQVEKRLADGFDKTTKTFNDILKRLALIDDAQQKITELSSNVVSLQEVLADKRSRGAFGEVQLNALIRNVLPEQHFSIQHTLSNGKIADCILWLPEPTGNVVIDSKFPLESYRSMTNVECSELERKASEKQFKVDIKKHIKDISEKYLIDKETADGAIMFIPAEAVFAEIHGHFPELVEYANQMRVWLTSPTTLMAVLTTARAVLKDEATREQVHVIQAHLSGLAGDFGRFKQRFNNLAKHIDQAAVDVKQIHTSADKISNRFEKIEQVEIHQENDDNLLETSSK